MPPFPVEELKVIDVTVRLFTEPSLRLDRPRLERFLADEKMRKGRAMLEAGRALGIRLPTTVEEMKTFLMDVEAELQSSDKFKLALEAIGYTCPMKWSEKQEKDIPALAKNDDGMQELLEHDDSRVQALAAARLGVKSTIDESRAERLLDADSRGALPVYLSYAAAKTLRFGGGDKSNWQNFRRGGEIRKSVLAPPGHKLVIGDLSQIEYRLLCWLTGQTDKLEALAAGRDLYCEYASQFYGETVEKSDKPRRGVGKQGILMGGYGAGKKTMIRTAAGGGYGPKVFLSDAEGQRMVDLYRSGHGCVVRFWDWCGSALNYLGNGAELSYQVNGQTILEIADHKIWLPNDTALDYTGMRWARACDIFPDRKDDGEGPSWWEPTRKGWSRMWGSKLTADIVQALARVVIVSALVKIAKQCRVALQVHDELALVVPDAFAGPVTPKPVTLKDATPGTALHLMLEIMATPPEWCRGIPLEAEGIVSERYEK